MDNNFRRSINKEVSGMLHLYKGDISDKATLDNFTLDSGDVIKIDTIVNAAKPTLMGSLQGVDGAIHKKIDDLLQNENSSFNIKICEELDEKNDGIHKKIRCQRGKAKLTKGYGLCKYVIHVVGSIFDAETGKTPKFLGKWMRKCGLCSSSRVRILESCYYEIVKVIREHPDIENVAIPIIGSGEYGFPFKMAIKIAVASVGNALLEWKQEDEEYFNDVSEGLQNVIFFIWDKDMESKVGKQILQKKYVVAEKVFKDYKKIFSAKAQVVSQNSLKSQLQYFIEIIKYDRNRGYFCIARITRLVLAFLRLFSVYTYLKDLFAGHNWQKRRFLVELIVFWKILFAIGIGIFIVSCNGSSSDYFHILRIVIKGWIIYDLVDTVTYLMSLLLMADIQNPSANVIRSLLLLLLNYVEVSLDMSCLYLQQYQERGMDFFVALETGVMGNMPEFLEMQVVSDYILLYGNAALKFFFLTMVFGYLSGHMRQKTFRR